MGDVVTEAGATSSAEACCLSDSGMSYRIDDNEACSTFQCSGTIMCICHYEAWLYVAIIIITTVTMISICSCLQHYLSLHVCSYYSDWI